MKEKYTDKEILGAFLLVNDYRMLSNEELADVKVSITNLLKENEKLKKKLDKYESPEDMTLMYMWCTEKVKDENKKLKNQQKEFIKYLEENIDEINFRAILSKYNEIIGGENEKI